MPSPLTKWFTLNLLDNTYSVGHNFVTGQRCRKLKIANSKSTLQYNVLIKKLPKLIQRNVKLSWNYQLLGVVQCISWAFVDSSTYKYEILSKNWQVQWNASDSVLYLPQHIHLQKLIVDHDAINQSTSLEIPIKLLDDYQVLLEEYSTLKSLWPKCGQRITYMTVWVISVTQTIESSIHFQIYMTK